MPQLECHCPLPPPALQPVNELCTFKSHIYSSWQNIWSWQVREVSLSWILTPVNGTAELCTTQIKASTSVTATAMLNAFILGEVINPLKIRADGSSFTWVSGQRRAPLRPGLLLCFRDRCQFSTGFLQIFGRSYQLFSHLRVEYAESVGIYTLMAPVLPHLRWRPCPFLAAVT